MDHKVPTFAIVCFLTAAAPAWAITPVMVQDFEKVSAVPEVWVVGIPNQNAAVSLSAAHPFEGKQCLKLHYHFLDRGQFQYLGVPNKVNIQVPIHKLRYALYGNGSKCSYGLQVQDAAGKTHQYRSLSSGKGQGGIVDFTGWKEVAFDLDAPHEIWGGNKSSKIDYPIMSVTFAVGQPVANVGDQAKPLTAEGDLYFDALSVNSEKSSAETLSDRQVTVTSPEYCAEIKGRTTIDILAIGFKSVTAKCWKQGPGFGTDSTVAAVSLDAQGRGSFVFPADQYPHGPVNLRLHGEGDGFSDNCYLQLYNRGGVSWNEGMPKAPPAAEGMTLLFADDFTGPLSIGGDKSAATYYDHKPPHGWQDFSQHRFSDYGSAQNPFTQIDTYLRIRASDRLQSSGLISSLKSDGRGIKATLPCYFECRFIGPNAIGTWPAFWLLTDNLCDPKSKPCDELDIIEAYGGEGPGHPNAKDTYMITPHAWEQKGSAAESMTEKFYRTKSLTHMGKFGIPSTWFDTPHTYGCKITESDTIYYCDNIEVVRHPTLPICKQKPLYFLINLATGGGWPVDLSRYHGVADMYVDYVRVYEGGKKQ